MVSSNSMWYLINGGSLRIINRESYKISRNLHSSLINLVRQIWCFLITNFLKKMLLCMMRSNISIATKWKRRSQTYCDVISRTICGGPYRQLSLYDSKNGYKIKWTNQIAVYRYNWIILKEYEGKQCISYQI